MAKINKDDEIKKELGIYPFGSKILVDRKDIISLQNFYLDVLETPLPKGILEHFNKQHNALRKLLGLVSLEEKEKEALKVSPSAETFLMKQYVCSCQKKKKK